MTANEDGGLSRRGARLLGFDEKCRCGHEEGMHDQDGPCAVLECKCNGFEADRRVR